MGFHLVVLAKLNLTCTTAHGGASAVVTNLVWPFVLKLSNSSRPFHQAYTDMFYASRLFFFQLGQIVFNADAEQAGLAGRTRFERALRLVHERLTRVRRSPVPESESDEDSLRLVSMLSL